MEKSRDILARDKAKVLKAETESQPLVAGNLGKNGTQEFLGAATFHKWDRCGDDTCHCCSATTPVRSHMVFMLKSGSPPNCKFEIVKQVDPAL